MGLKTAGLGTKGGLVQRFINTSYDIVKSVADNLDIITTLNDSIVGGDIDAAIAAPGITAADVAITNADVVITNGDVAQTAADVISTGADAAAVAADLATVQTIYDSFDDRYLGVKASDPTLDNDGNALIEGALYWNSISNEMRAYTGVAWVVTYNASAGISDSAPGIALTLDENYNVTLGSMTSAAGANGVLHLSNATVLPAANPVDGIVFAPSGGILRIRQVNGYLYMPDAADTLVGKATTDVLTNKTLTSPILNTGISGTAFVDDDTFAGASAVKVASQASIKNYIAASRGFQNLSRPSADHIVNNSTTLTTIDGLNISVTGGVYYSVEILIRVNLTLGTACGLKCGVSFASPQGTGLWEFFNENVVSAHRVWNANTATFTASEVEYADFGILRFTGVLRPTGGDTTFNVQVAQATAEAVNITFDQYSYIKVKEILNN